MSTLSSSQQLETLNPGFKTSQQLETLNPGTPTTTLFRNSQQLETLNPGSPTSVVIGVRKYTGQLNDVVSSTIQSPVTPTPYRGVYVVTASVLVVLLFNIKQLRY